MRNFTPYKYLTIFNCAKSQEDVLLSLILVTMH